MASSTSCLSSSTDTGSKSHQSSTSDRPRFCLFVSWGVQVLVLLASVVLLSLEFEASMKRENNRTREIPKWIIFNLVVAILLLSVTGLELAISSVMTQLPWRVQRFMISGSMKLVFAVAVVAWEFVTLSGEDDGEKKIASMTIVVTALNCVVLFVSASTLIYLIGLYLSTRAPTTARSEPQDEESRTTRLLPASQITLPRPPTIILTTDTETKSIYDEIPGSPDVEDKCESEAADRRRTAWPLTAHPISRERSSCFWASEQDVERGEGGGKAAEQRRRSWSEDFDLPSDYM
ncbi:hypothetical protein PVAG01_04597 [Phlyctema vagabunda]|uniref:Transmembrane protein n=1 Tax=Phlyctema vagabunda TaxID=108571 RepID=A0ABR4PHP1_9HELO